MLTMLRKASSPQRAGVQFWGVKSYTWIFNCMGVGSSNPTFNGQLYNQTVVQITLSI